MPDIIPSSLGGIISQGHIGAKQAEGIKLLFDKVVKESDAPEGIGGNSDGIILLDGAVVKEKNPKERPMDHVNIQNQKKGKARVGLNNQPGLTVILADGSLSHPGQRSWVSQGIIHVNYSCLSFGRAFDKGPTIFNQYVEQIIVWEIMLASMQENMDPMVHTMRQEFNKMIMPVFENFWFS
ncbi:hypothetical protein FJ208_02500 [Candidatus Gribaldobacteria bacterium]|nr:hypothetical protein [Candidatus Gribaldobacteria bacterium]